MSSGTCTLHSWNDGSEADEGSPRMGQSVDQRLKPDEPEEEEEEGPLPALRPTESPWLNRLRSHRVAVQGSNENIGRTW